MLGLLIITIILGVVGAFLVYFVDFCFNESNILDWYYLWLLRKVEPKYPKLAKPLGLCPICFGFWIGFFYYGLLCIIMKHPIEFYLVFVPVNSFTTMKLFKNEE